MKTLPWALEFRKSTTAVLWTGGGDPETRNRQRAGRGTGNEQPRARPVPQVHSGSQCGVLLVVLCHSIVRFTARASVVSAAPLAKDHFLVGPLSACVVFLSAVIFTCSAEPEQGQPRPQPQLLSSFLLRDGECSR